MSKQTWSKINSKLTPNIDLDMNYAAKQHPRSLWKFKTSRKLYCTFEVQLWRQITLDALSVKTRYTYGGLFVPFRLFILSYFRLAVVRGEKTTG